MLFTESLKYWLCFHLVVRWVMYFLPGVFFAIYTEHLMVRFQGHIHPNPSFSTGDIWKLFYVEFYADSNTGLFISHHDDGFTVIISLHCVKEYLFIIVLLRFDKIPEILNPWNCIIDRGELFSKDLSPVQHLRIKADIQNSCDKELYMGLVYFRNW